MVLHVYGLHRSGTTMVTADLAAQMNAINFHEYYVEEKHGFEDTEIGIELVPGYKGQTKDDLFKLLKKYWNENYVIKFLPQQVPNYIFDYINHNSKIICVERRNKLDQFISYVIASRMNAWRNIRVEKEAREMIEVTPEEMLIFAQLHKEYYTRKEQIIDKEVIIYEDIENNSKFSKENMVDQRGYYKTIYELPNRLDYISNKKEVIKFINFIQE